MLTIVLDTSVVATAFRSRRGASFALLREIARGRAIPIATPPLSLEYEDVLKRPEQRRASGLTLAEVDDRLAELAAILEPVDAHFKWRPQLRDPETKWS